MTQFDLRKLAKNDLEAVHQIDRSESVEKMYRLSGEELESYDDSIELEGDPAFWEKLLDRWRSDLDSGAEAIGAYDGETMIGIAIIKHGIRPGVDQIVATYVSADYRLSGIAKSLYLELEDLARAAGTQQLFVSTTPNGSAVGFYRSQGFEYSPGSTCTLDPEEEQHIPMVKNLKPRPR